MSRTRILIICAATVIILVSMARPAYAADTVMDYNDMQQLRNLYNNNGPGDLVWDIVPGFSIKGDEITSDGYKLTGLEVSGKGLSGNLRMWNTERLASMDLSNNEFTGLDFRNLPLLTTLNLANNRLTVIDTTTFAGLARLASLNLNGNDIYSIDDNSFVDTALVTLDLGNNQLSSISTDLFAGLTNLESLNLNGNNIGSIALDAFSGLNSLVSLDLGNNTLSGTISATRAFSNLTGLQYLNLSGNSFTALDVDAFATLGSLTALDLSGNPLGAIADGTFANQSRLISLRLANNGLSTVTAATFSGLTALEELDLGGNNLGLVPTAAFANLDRLTALSLRNNGIGGIAAADFTTLTGLTRLDLSDNLISGIAAGTFGSMGNLTDVNLSGNRLTHLNSGMFDGLDNLTSLDLSANGTTGMDRDVFTKLTALRELRLAGNMLTRLDTGVFSGLDSLDTIDLSYNRLMKLNPGVFTGLPSLDKVYLQGNRLPLGQLYAVQSVLAGTGYTVGNFDNQTEVYFQRRVQVLAANDFFEVPGEDYSVNGTASTVTYTDDGWATSTAVPGGTVVFGATGDYQVRLTNSEVTATASSGEARTTTGTISVVDALSTSFAPAPVLGGLSSNGARLAGAYLPAVVGHLNAGGTFDLTDQNDQAGMYVMQWLDSANVLDLSLDGTDRLIGAFYNPAALAAMFNQMVPEIHFGAARGLREGAAQPLQHWVRDLALAPWPGALPCGNTAGPLRMHAQLVGGRGRLDSDARHQGYHLDSYGATIGMEYTGHLWRFGGAVNYTRLDQDWSRYHGKVKTDSVNAALYGTRMWDDFLLTGQVGGGYGDVEAKRTIAALGTRAEADYDVTWFGADITAARRFWLGNTGLSPSLGMAWVHSRTDAVREQWNNGDTARLGRENFNSLTARAGLDLEHSFCFEDGRRIRPRLGVGANVEMGDRQSRLRSTIDSAALGVPVTVTLKGRKMDRFHVDLNAGIEGRLTEWASLGLGYRGDFGASTRLHQGELSLTLTW